jgi:hypothetical protein
MQTASRYSREIGMGRGADGMQGMQAQASGRGMPRAMMRGRGRGRGSISQISADWRDMAFGATLAVPVCSPVCLDH